MLIDNLFVSHHIHLWVHKWIQRLSRLRRGKYITIVSEDSKLDCKQSLFSQSSLSSAGLERAKWPRGKLERGASSPRLLVFYFLSISSLAWPSWGTARSLIRNSTLSEELIMSLIYFKNSKGPRQLPWGIPHLTVSSVELKPLIETYCFPLVRWLANHCRGIPLTP